MTYLAAHARPTATLPRRLLFAIRKRIASLRDRHTTLKRLNCLDERALRDIGLTRGDVEAAGQLPLARDAAEALTRASLGRAGQW